jgi:hypothetical protein
MSWRIQVSIIAIFALFINSIGLCAASASNCSRQSCAAQEQEGTCPLHRQHQHPPAGHECCQMAECSSPAEFRAEPDSHAANHIPLPLCFAIRAPLFDLTDAAARQAQLVEAHSPPWPVSVFIAIHSLLL